MTIYKVTLISCSLLSVLACGKNADVLTNSSGQAARASSFNVNVGIDNASGTQVSTTVSESKAESEYRRPAIRHDNYDGKNDISGTKMLEPETLNNVITNLLGEELDIDGENPISRDFSRLGAKTENTYPVYLGSLDYQAVINRNREVAATMPLIIDRVAKAACQQLVTNNNHNIDFDGGDEEDISDELHMLLNSRPIDSDTANAVTLIIEAAASEGVDNNTKWQAVCTFYLLKEGSILIN